MAQEITDKEHTWLVLKWGTNPYFRLANLSVNRLSRLSEVEQRGAELGRRFIIEEKEELSRLLAEFTRKEIDDEIIKSIISRAADENN